jgi:hypothetical protein
MTTLRPGQRVIVSGAAGTVNGEVLSVETAASIPDLIAAQRVERVRELLAEFGIVEIAIIRHVCNGRPVTFCALGDGKRVWRDLREQPLTIAPVPALKSRFA